jgi:hypothetical protein
MARPFGRLGLAMLALAWVCVLCACVFVVMGGLSFDLR